MTTSVGVDILVALANKLTGPLKDAEGVVVKAAERMNKRLQLSMKLAGAGAVATGVAYGVNRLVTGFTDSIREVERAKGELATLGVRDLDVVLNKAREMQMELAGVTADAFVRASYDIKSGISSLTDQGVAEMTAAAMVTAKATKGIPEQMTSLFATSYGIFKKQYAIMSDADFGNMFGAALSASVQQFKTDGAAMQQAIESAGAGAVNLGMAMTEQLTLLGMMQQQMQAGEAGTALRAFATNAAKAHENFAKMKVTAERPVKVRILDENGQLRAMPDILADLQARYGETLDAFEAAEIKDAFGTDEAMKMINALYGQEAAVRANADALEDAAGRGAEFTAEMARAADNNWDAAMVLMGQKMDVIQQKIGERLLPVVQRLLPVIDAVIATTFNWIDANPELVTGIGAAVVALGAMAAIVASLLLGASALVSGWAFMSYGATRLGLSVLKLGKWVLGGGRTLMWLGRAVLPMVGKAILLIGRALIANPIGLAIMAIAGGALLLYEYWEPVSGFFSDLWGKVTDAATSAWDGLRSLFDRYNPRQMIMAAWESVTGFFSSLWGRIRSGVSAGWDAIKSLFLNYTPLGLVITHWDSIVESFAGYWASIKSGVSAGWDAIKALFLTYHPIGILISNWDGIVQTFSGFWASIKSGISTGWNAIKGKLAEFGPAKLIHAAWEGLVEWFGSLWGRVKAKFTSITWADILPNWDWGFITDIDLSEFIKWPEPPAWLTYLMDNGPYINSADNPANAAPVEPSGLAGTKFAALAERLEAALANQELPTFDGQVELAGYKEDLMSEISRIEQQIATLDNAADEAAIAQLEGDLAAKQAELQAVEAEIAEVSARAVEVQKVLQAIMETDVEIDINMAAIDAALAKLRQVAALQTQIGNGNSGGVTKPASSAPTQARAKGGKFNPGWLLTGEEGPELEYRTEGGFIAHNRALQGMVAMAGRARDLAQGISFPQMGASLASNLLDRVQIRSRSRGKSCLTGKAAMVSSTLCAPRPRVAVHWCCWRVLAALCSAIG